MTKNENVKKTIVKVSSKVTFYSLLGNIVNIPCKILIAAFLQPAGYGLLSIVNLILNYSDYGNLGTFNGMNRKIPLLLGKGEEDKANKIAVTTAIWMSFALFFTILFLFALYFVGYDFNGLLTFQNLLIIVFLLIANRLRTFLANYNRGFGAFDVIVTKYSISSILTPVLSAILAYYFYISGVLLAQTITSYIILFFFIRYFYNIDSPALAFSFSLSEIVKLIKESFPLFLKKVITNLYSTLEILIITLFFSISSLGIYAFGMGIFMSLRGIVSSLTAVINRNMLFEFGGKGKLDRSIFRKYFESNIVCFFIAVSLLVGISYIFFEIIITNFIPIYADSLVLARILFIEGIFIQSAIIGISYLNACGKLMLNNYIYLIGIATKLFLVYILMYYDMNLLGIAISSAFGSFLVFSLALHFSITNIYDNKFQSLRIIIPLIPTLFFLHLILSEASYFVDYATYESLIYYERIMYLIIIGIFKSLFFCISTIVLYSLFFFSFRPEKQLYNIVLAYLNSVGLSQKSYN